MNKCQVHHHTRTCAKKHKVITIKKGDGHGRLDGLMEDTELKNIQLCRFNFPRFPLDKTRLIFAIAKESDEEDVKKRKGT